ncbi:MAG: MerR family transcriptional regulator [Pseudomonadota bacterium]
MSTSGGGKLMYIGEIAKQTGASPKALRHYEALGLLGPIRRVGVYRVYSDTTVRQVKLIRHAQGLGFRLHELSTLLEDVADDAGWLGLIAQIRLKQASIQREIERLRALESGLDRIVDEILACPEMGDDLSPMQDSLAQCDTAPAPPVGDERVDYAEK